MSFNNVLASNTTSNDWKVAAWWTLGFTAVILTFLFPGIASDIIVGSIILVVAAVITVLALTKLFGEHRQETILVWVFLWLIVSLGIHAWNSVAIEPLKAEFCHVANTGSYSEDWVDTVEGYTALDYFGALDNTIATRDRRCANRGIYYFGGWHTGSNGQSFGGVYIFTTRPIAWWLYKKRWG